MVMEAIALKIHKEDQEAQKRAKRKEELRNAREDMKQYQ